MHSFSIIYCEDDDLLVRYGNLAVSFNLYTQENTTLCSLINIQTRRDASNETWSLSSCPTVVQIGCFTENHTSSYPK